MGHTAVGLGGVETLKTSSNSKRSILLTAALCRTPLPSVQGHTRTSLGRVQATKCCITGRQLAADTHWTKCHRLRPSDQATHPRDAPAEGAEGASSASFRVSCERASRSHWIRSTHRPPLRTGPCSLATRRHHHPPNIVGRLSLLPCISLTQRWK